MEEQIDLKLFTVADLKNYFIHNQPVDLLSDEVITCARAIATIHNPYVTDDMVVVSALFVNRKVVAYTYVFPEKLTKPSKLIFWNTVIYVDQQYEGRGFAYIVIGQMAELYGPDYFDLDAVPASVVNLKFAGLQVDYVNQYYLEQKHINTCSFRGKMAAMIEQLRLKCTSKEKELYRLINGLDYQLRYVNYIDDNTYAFIQAHSLKDMFLRSQDMFNWILTYPFSVESPMGERVKDPCYFRSVPSCFHRYAVQVWYKSQLVGIYILRYTADELYLEYLYIESDYEQIVFVSIAEHIVQFKRPRFFTANKNLATWLNSYHIFAHFEIYHKSFSHSNDFIMKENRCIQAGDGDNII